MNKINHYRHNFIKIFSYLLFCFLIAACSSNKPQTSVFNDSYLKESEKEDHSVLHKVVFYIPNRAFDLMDIFRLRIKVGPGLAAGVRASELAQAYVGAQTSVYAGLPGPRCSATIPFPAGLESYNGVALGPVDATANMWLGPDYSPTEFGASIHPFLIGLDFGIDPYEILDFGAGIFNFDIRDDDF